MKTLLEAMNKLQESLKYTFQPSSGWRFSKSEFVSIPETEEQLRYGEEIMQKVLSYSDIEFVRATVAAGADEYTVEPKLNLFFKNSKNDDSKGIARITLEYHYYRPSRRGRPIEEAESSSKQIKVQNSLKEVLYENDEFEDISDAAPAIKTLVKFLSNSNKASNDIQNRAVKTQMEKMAIPLVNLKSIFDDKFDKKSINYDDIINNQNLARDLIKILDKYLNN